MSSPAKGTFLRIVVPKDSAGNILALLSPAGRVLPTEKALHAGRLTTEQIVQYIREYSRLRDELLHTMRTLGIPREPRENFEDETDHRLLTSSSWKKLEEINSTSQSSRSRIEKLERQIEGLKKQIDRTHELIETGFSQKELTPLTGTFTRIAGRMPTRRLEAAQNSIQSSLKGQAIIAVGRRKDDYTYLLLASPSEKASQAHQILILYEFVQAEFPETDQPDLQKSLSLLLQDKDRLTRELEDGKKNSKAFFSEASEELNHQADKVQEASILLKAFLRMGDGSYVVRAFARFEKPPSQKVLDSLAKQGTLVDTE